MLKKSLSVFTVPNYSRFSHLYICLRKMWYQLDKPQPNYDNVVVVPRHLILHSKIQKALSQYFHILEHFNVIPFNYTLSIIQKCCYRSAIRFILIHLHIFCHHL